MSQTTLNPQNPTSKTDTFYTQFEANTDPQGYEPLGCASLFQTVDRHLTHQGLETVIRATGAKLLIQGEHRQFVTPYETEADTYNHDDHFVLEQAFDMALCLEHDDYHARTTLNFFFEEHEMDSTTLQGFKHGKGVEGCTWHSDVHPEGKRIKVSLLHHGYRGYHGSKQAQDEGSMQALLTSLLPLREAIRQGDYRALYVPALAEVSVEGADALYFQGDTLEARDAHLGCLAQKQQHYAACLAQASVVSSPEVTFAFNALMDLFGVRSVYTDLTQRHNALCHLEVVACHG